MSMPDMKQFEKDERRRLELIQQVMMEQDVHFITAVVMAGDMLSAEKATQMVADGMKPLKASVYIGSYARLGWLCEQYSRGNLPRNWLLKEFKHEWVACDPDDTYHVYRDMWNKAFQQNRNRTIMDGKSSLPGGTFLTIYRGQQSTVFDNGLSWSLDYGIAHRFARGAAVRVPTQGVVIKGSVHHSLVLAYLTGRGESEVIVDPVNVIQGD